MNSKVSKSDSQWEPCGEGIIKLAGDTIREQQIQHSRRQFLRKASVTAAVVACGGFAGWTLMGPKNQLNSLYDNPNFPGGIACSEVMRLLPEYVAGSLDETKLVASIDVHLEGCSHCRHKHEALLASATA